MPPLKFIAQLLARPASAFNFSRKAAFPSSRGRWPSAWAHAHWSHRLTFAQAQGLQLPHDHASRRHGRYFPFKTSRIASISTMGF
jgi:hypothetical protein